MVFSSHPLYQLDPDPNNLYMLLDHHEGTNETSSTAFNNTMQHTPLQPPPATPGSRNNIRPAGSMTDKAWMAKIPLPETSLKCPRCESTNTKFCYFNNYSLTQPRHYCKTCRRYWTRGGALRNVPIGGGCKRSASKRSSKKRSKSPAHVITTTATLTDHQINGTNMTFYDGVLQFPFYYNPLHCGMNQMGYDQSGDDHYSGGGSSNNYGGGAHTDPHIAMLFQTGCVVSLDNSSYVDYDQWSRSLSETSTLLKEIESASFPFLTNLVQQEHLSQPSARSSLVDTLGSSSIRNVMNMQIMDRIVATQFTNVKTEGDK